MGRTREYWGLAWQFARDVRAESSIAAAFELARLRRMPRLVPARTSLVKGIHLEVPDAASFLASFEEIFRREIYRFPCEHNAPLVLDVGANVGLATIYFKRLYPGARIVAYEADPEIFAVLERNVAAASVSGVELRNVAVWTSVGTLCFHREGADAGRVHEMAGADETVVRAVRLRDDLTSRVDLLKIDIEGAEFAVIEDCADRLALVDRIFVEYHSFAGERQVLPELLLLLRGAGFRVWVDSPRRMSRPLCGVRLYRGMDLQLNIFGFREQQSDRAG